MSTLKFSLRKDKADKNGLMPVELVYHIAGNLVPSGGSIRGYYRIKKTKLLPENWNEKATPGAAKFLSKEAVKFLNEEGVKRGTPAKDFSLFLKSAAVNEINGEILNITNKIARIEERFQGEKFDTDRVIEELKGSKDLQGRMRDVTSLFEYMDRYVRENKSSRKAASLVVYATAKKHLEAFQIASGKKITFSTIDHEFFQEFQGYLISLGLKNSTIAKQLSTVKTFLSYAKANGVEISDRYKNFKIKKGKALPVIALTDKEFEIIYNADLSKNKKLDQTRDIFCFACATGLRDSDLRQIQWGNIKEKEIIITTVKTGQTLRIPRNKHSNGILEKYKGQPLPLPSHVVNGSHQLISNQKLNVFLKELGKKVKINAETQLISHKGEDTASTFHPKHELMSIHMGRRTFVSLCLKKGISFRQIMKWTGHTTMQAYARYELFENDDLIETMEKSWG